MTSPAQREANRANARKSTGPRSAEGKRASRMNALRHGLYAEHGPTAATAAAVRDAFEARHEDFRAAFRPRGRYERALVRRLAEIDWRLGGALAAEAMVLSAAIDAPGTYLGARQAAPKLDRIGRAEARLMRAFDHTHAMLMRRRAFRRRS